MINLPAARSWRDIPQPVKPRTMSRGGRWRLLAAGLRVGAVLALIGGTAWGIWRLAGAVQGDPRMIPAAARAVPVRAPELVTDGAHTREWLIRTLALPPHVTLMELDLAQLHERLLADGQVVTARLTRQFPDRLIVWITERIPVARVMTEWAGRQLPLVVARDGTIFFGEGYTDESLATLPWLDGISLARAGDGFAPIAGMEAVADLLAQARVEAEHLYRSWNVVSLARFEADRELEVRTFGGATIVFNTAQLFLPQLARLDYMWARVSSAAAGKVRIDLSFGREVPVRIELPAGEARTGQGPAAAGRPALASFLPFPSQIQREL